jgi:DNA invertase Pin-like site-specific DNA recombinase
MASKKITVIPAKTRPETIIGSAEVLPKKRVAAYARVSTDMDEQLNSYEAQISYYTEHIQKNPEWTFVKVYTDEGISGLMTKKREGFQTMIKDALSGKIDLILTKSVSRFARNTVDTLTTVRKLKDKGIEVYFEKENIWTMDSKGELLITIMSSLAQEESRSISENVTWGQRKRFADGKVSMPYKQFLGYKKGSDGRPEVVPEEAKIVRRIYQEFLLGMTYTGIAKALGNDGILTPGGKEIWSSSTIKSILQNEKYKGDALLQKRFTVDYLTKKQKENEGEVPQYYVTNSHEGIVSDEVFDMVQVEIERRRKYKVNGSSQNFFSGWILCGCCGEPFTRKVWHSTTKYKRYIWQCGKKYAGKEPCSTPHFHEDEIKDAFVKLLSKLYRQKGDVLETCDAVISRVLDTSKDKIRAVELEAELDEAYHELSERLRIRAQHAEDTETERTSYEAALQDYEQKSVKLEKLKERISDKDKRRFNCTCFIERLGKLEENDIAFNEKLWISLLDYVTVPGNGKKELTFHLRNGEGVMISIL